MGDRWSLAPALELAAAVMRAAGYAQQAARFYGTVAAVRETIASPISGGDRRDYERDLASVRAQLDETTFRTEWAAGRLVPLVEAVADARALLETIAD